MWANNPELWVNLFHDCSTITAALAAAIAAVSSVSNGRALKDAKKKLEDVQQANGNRKRKKTLNAESKDWYEPPELN